mgnify:CR=1 FL=1
MASKKPASRPARVETLRSDFEALGRLLEGAAGSAAAAIVRERRILSELLEQLEKTEAVPFVDQLAARRRTGTKDTGPPSRRRRSG